MKPHLLVIWDFDGVIADSEHLWVENWSNILKKQYNIKLSSQQQQYYLEGKSEKTKIALLSQNFPQIVFNDDFWQTLRNNETNLIQTKLKITPNVIDIFNDQNFAHCIATGAIPEKHQKKIEQLHLQKYFSTKNTFTATMVKNGKPEPDLFLYAAQKMGYTNKNCIIIEDSIAGIMAAKKALMQVITYIGATNHNTAQYIHECQKCGSDYIAATMIEVHNILKDLNNKITDCNK